MAKIDIELVHMVLKRKGLEASATAEILQELKQEAAKDEGEDKPKDGKYQYVVMAYDPEGKLEGLELTASVIQIPEENSVFVTEESVRKAVYEFNTTKKGRRMPVRTVGEAFEHVPAKIFKEFGVKVKTKEPVFILRTDGIIPFENTDSKIDKRRKD